MTDINIIKKRINATLQIMEEMNLDAVYQPHEDEYLGEYIPINSERLNWISNFSGSAGSIVITKRKSFLFVDGRYTLQAANETAGLNIEVVDISKINFLKWLYLNKSKIKNIAIDKKIISHTNFLRIKNTSFEKSIVIKDINKNIIDIIWKKDELINQKSCIIKYEKKFSGLTSKLKRTRLSKEILSLNAQCLFIPNPDSVAWLLNIRGTDLKYTPVVLANAILHSNNKVSLFLENTNIKKEIKKYLGHDISIFNKEELEEVLRKLGEKKYSMLIDPIITSEFVYSKATLSKIKIIPANDLIIKAKAIKNNIEIKGAINAHIKDGVAVCKFLYWFYKKAHTSITELDVVNKINYFRSINKEYLSNSFPTIAGSGPNGSIIHYNPTTLSNREIKKLDLLLLDSGGQYKDGTTDITRTLIRGKPNLELKRKYTLVLKGHLAINMSKFPYGTTGAYLDALARNHLWNNELNYNHGTGHGVGHCLNVHEGPQGISSKNIIILEENMVFSNEPGYYSDNKYGIRIENLVYVSKNDNRKNNKSKYMKINTLTKVPYERRLIEKNMLSTLEVQWIDRYHKNIYKLLSSYLNKEEKNWLKENCKKL